MVIISINGGKQILKNGILHPIDNEHNIKRGLLEIYGNKYSRIQDSSKRP